MSSGDSALALALRELLADAIADSLRDPQVLEELRAVVREELEAREARTPAGDDRLMTVADAARYAGVQAATVREWLRGGKLAAVRVGRQWRLRRADLERYLSDAPAPGTDVDVDAEVARIVAMSKR